MATSLQNKVEDYQHHHVNNYNRLDESCGNSTSGDVIVGIDPPSHYPQQNIMGIQEPSKPFAFDALIVSMVSYICCCSVLGFFGIIASLLSYSDHRVNDQVSHKSKRNIALGCSIAGIVIGVLTVITVIAVIVTPYASMTDALNSAMEEDSHGSYIVGEN